MSFLTYINGKSGKLCIDDHFVYPWGNATGPWISRNGCVSLGANMHMADQSVMDGFYIRKHIIERRRSYRLSSPWDVSLPPHRDGFSLIELLVVLSVTVMMTGLLLPAMSQLRESANKIVCGSNVRQMGQALFMYGHDNDDALPKSRALTGKNNTPQELMRTYIGSDSTNTTKWNGLGVLYKFRYCGAIGCFYCPSHLGDHTFEKYYNDWLEPAENDIYGNYHFSGDRDWKSNKVRTLHSLLSESKQVLVTDGLRTARDFNHVTGMNILYADGSVRWREGAEDIIKILPDTKLSAQEQVLEYLGLWKLVEDRRR